MNKDDVKRSIYITYKSRINTAERLLKTENLIQGLNVYYSIFLTVLSIYSINNSSSKLSMAITISSVILLVSIVFLGSKKYGERARELKNNYIQLGALYRKISGMIDNDPEQLCSIYDEYKSLLNNSENHNEYDYFKAIKNMSDEKLSRGNTLKYFVNCIGKAVIITFLIILPFFLKYILLLFDIIIKV